jgi:hypothetical protein
MTSAQLRLLLIGLVTVCRVVGYAQASHPELHIADVTVIDVKGGPPQTHRCVADMVLLDANPLDDIRNTQKIAGVVVNGRYLSRADLDKMLAGAENAAATK